MVLSVKTRLVLVVLGAASVFACSSDSGEDRVLASYNGEKLTQGEFQAYLDYKNIKTKSDKELNDVLDAYLDKKSLANVILKQNMLDKKEVEVEVDEFRKQMVISRYIEKYLAEKVSEEAVRNFYAVNLERYKSKRTHVAHILIRTNAKMSEQEKSALLTKAQEVYSRAMANEDFSKLAKEYSEDKLSAKKGGDLGWIQEGAIDPVFSKTAFALEPGSVSKPIATPFGFHVVKLLEGPEDITRPYEKVKGDIRYELRQQAKLAEIKRLKSLVKIVK